MNQISIYCLYHKDVPFYIGKSKNPYKQRLYRHKKKYGKDIILEIIDKVEENEWKFWEKYWISQFKTWGFNLKNKNEGGGGINGYELIGKKHSISTKLKMRKAKLGKPSNRKGKPCSEEHKLKLSISMKNKGVSPLKGIHYHTKESREKISKIHKGKKISNKQKEIISQTQSGKKLSNEHILAIIKGNRNKKGMKYIKNKNYENKS